MNNGRNKRFLLGVVTAAFALLMLASVPASAQFNASLSGTVEDATGAVLSGATATLLNTGTQQQVTVTSTGEGSYRFSELAPGSYKLTVTAAGFKPTTVDNVNVVAETPRNIDVKLATGGDTQSVEVSADTLPVLETSDANIGATLSGEEIERLPIFGADPYELLRTAPGITGDGARNGAGQAVFLPNNVGVGGSNSGIYQTENQIQIAADGQRVADNNIMIDGVSVNSLVHGGAAVVTPNQESVANLTVISTSYDAADGRNSGAQVKVTTKSGTNDLHGSLYSLYNEPGLNAYNRYGGPIIGSLPARVSIKQRTYAASLGGPIVKNKLFIFGSFQGYGQGNNTVSAGEYVETAQYRSSVITARPGGLSAGTLADPHIAPRIRNLITSNCADYANNQGTYVPNQVNGAGPVVTQTEQSGPYCNVVPGGLDLGSPTAGGASQLGVYLSNFSSGSAAAPGPSTKIGGAFVGGGLDGLPDVEQVQLSIPSHSRGKQYNGRIDFQPTSKDLIAGNVFFTKLDNLTSSDSTSRVLGDVPFKPLNSAATIIFIHTFSPAWLNEFRANGTRFHDDGPKDFGSVDLGIPYTYIQNIPFNNIDYGVVAGSTTAATLAQNTIETSDMVTHTFGSHALKLGGGIRWEQDNDNLNGGVRPDFAFAGFWNLANDASLFEAQTVNPINGLAPETAAHFRSQTYYAYAQHDWKVTPTLSFNAGFRYEIYTPWHRRDSGLSYLPSPSTTPGLEIVDLTLKPVKNLYNTDYGHFAPKLAFAWNPAYYDYRVVLRGGAAIAYNHLDLSLFENTIQNGPGVLSYGVCCGTSKQDFGTPFDGGLIDYVKGSGNNLNSFPANPAFATGVNAAGFPNALPGQGVPQVGLYGTAPSVKNPVSYLYSLETQTAFKGNVTLTVGYSGSTGHHYARLVNQNFLYPNSANGVSTSAGSDFLATTDSNQSYNALNARVVKLLQHGLQFDAIYTFSKSIDNVTNGDQSDGAANQTDPANNKLERGLSDNDMRNRFTSSVLYTSPKVHSGNKILNMVASGYQATSIISLHSGFSWTPVVNNGFTSVPNAATVSPIRPIAFAPGVSAREFGNNCGNDAFKTGSNFPNRGAGGTAGGTEYFSTAQPSKTVPYVPIIGRNSLTGPCYRDVDFSLAKQIQLEGLGHTATLRFQANIYNAFNVLQLEPITNEGFGTSITDPNFGKSAGSDAGRVLEFLARINF